MPDVRYLLWDFGDTLVDQRWLWPRPGRLSRMDGALPGAPQLGSRHQVEHRRRDQRRARGRVRNGTRVRA